MPLYKQDKEQAMTIRELLEFLKQQPLKKRDRPIYLQKGGLALPITKANLLAELPPPSKGE